MTGNTYGIPGSYILYADDDPDDQWMLTEMMQTVAPTVEISCFNNGLEAFGFLESKQKGQILPFIIVLDLNMPVWSGLDTLKALKENSFYADIPVFVFTNSDYLKHRDLALSMGALAFITKPYRRLDMQEVCISLAAYARHPTRFKAEK